MRLEDAIKSNKFRDEKHKASLNVLYTAYWLKSNFTQVFKACGLTMEQHNVLRILKGMHPEPMCVKEIGARILEKNSNVPRIIDRLVAKKLVKRAQSKQDKRETMISLTEKGIEVIDHARKEIDTYANSLINMNEDDARSLNELLEKMRSNEE
ncbi:MAG: MarR family transcriptional regulator [Chitinophagaceae bacterium]|nr:MarR family transcriptional regulator [Chitinophagaceae bacterium]